MNLKLSLKQYFGFDDFISNQKEVIETALNKKNILLIMPTGGGKSLCFQLPALLSEGTAIVISPLISLMKDQVQKLLEKGIQATYINSSLSKDEKTKRLENLVLNKYKLLYVSPERFRNKEFLEAVQKVKISYLVVDEAHCISEWGHDFRPDYSRIEEFRKFLKNPPVIAVTATATKKVQTDIIEKLGLKENEITLFHQGISRPNLFLSVEEIYGQDKKIEKILKIIKDNMGSGIVYFSLIKTLHQFSESLRKEKIPHLFYHGDLSPDQRRKNQNQFLAKENVLILATNAFGMGIDKPDIRYIIHGEIPGSLEAYYQEIGRAGRDNKPSFCSLLYDLDDISTQMEFIKWANPDEGFYQRCLRVLKEKKPQVLQGKLEFLKQELTPKSKDHRVETALNMLERFHVMEGDIDQGYEVKEELSANFSGAHLNAKMKQDHQRLLHVVNYAKSPQCRRVYLEEYFGFNSEPCQNCDICLGREDE